MSCVVGVFGVLVLISDNKTGRRCEECMDGTFILQTLQVNCCAF